MSARSGSDEDLVEMQLRRYGGTDQVSFDTLISSQHRIPVEALVDLYAEQACLWKLRRSAPLLTFGEFMDYGLASKMKVSWKDIYWMHLADKQWKEKYIHTYRPTTEMTCSICWESLPLCRCRPVWPSYRAHYCINLACNRERSAPQEDKCRSCGTTF